MPTLNQVHVDRPLSNIAAQFPSQQEKFMAERFYPVVQVNNRSDVYFRVDQERKALTEALDRMAAGGKATEVDWANETAPYVTQKFGLKRVVPTEVAQNADAPLGAKIRSTQHIVERLLLGREIRFAAQLNSDAGNTIAQTTNHWDDDSSDIIAAIETARTTVENACGNTPNTLLMDNTVFRRMRNQAQILSRALSGGSTESPAIVTRNTLAQVLDVERILVAGGIKNTNPEGQDPSLSRIWSDNVYFAYVAGGPAIDVETAGYTLVWNRDGAVNGWRTRTWFDDERDADMVQTDIYYTVEQVNGDCLYEFTDVLS